MAQDSYEINVKGVGAANQAAQINTSGVQRAIDQFASDLKKLDTSNFQRSLKDLTQGIQKSAIAATNFVSNMQKIEAQLSASIKAGLTSGIGKSITANQETNSKSESKKSEAAFDAKSSEKFVKSIDNLSDAIDKLTTGIKDNLKPKEKAEEKPTEKKENLASDVKKLLAAVGIGSIAKQIAENEFVSPARNAGMLISSNVVSNPRQIGENLLASYGNRVAKETGTIGGILGGGAGAIIGSFIPGVGPLAGGLIGQQAGNLIGETYGQTKMAPEIALQQRALQLDYYSSLSKQLPQYRQFAERQYGNGGFISSEAVSDPYLESKGSFMTGFSRFAGGNIGSGTTLGILKSLTAQGASSPQEVNITGNLLGQIARYTGKSSVDIERVYKSVEKSGMAPNEGLQRALSLLQTGLSVKETTDLIRNSSQRSDAYNTGQLNYLSSTPFQQITAQLAGNITGVNTEKFHHGTAVEQAHEIAKARKTFLQANRDLRAGRYNTKAIMDAQVMEIMQHISPAMTDNNLKVSNAGGDAGYIMPGQVQNKLIQQTQKEIKDATKGRSSQDIVNDALTSIGNSTQSMKGLTGATENLTRAFEDAAKSFLNPLMMRNMDPNTPLNFGSLPKKVSTQTAGGR